MTVVAGIKLVAASGLFVALLAASLDVYGLGLSPADVPPAEVSAVPREDGGVASGRTLFQTKGCVACHHVAGVPGDAHVGPDLTALPLVAGSRKAGLAAPDYVRESLVEPQAFVVPGYAGRANDPGAPPMPRLPLTPSEIDALVAFLLTPR
jgi:mono/diheme cytochrome c family protein